MTKKMEGEILLLVPLLLKYRNLFENNYYREGIRYS